MAKSRSGLSELSLLDQARSGDPDAFALLAMRHSTQIYRVSLKLLKNREDAEDNLQNALCKAFCKIRQFNAQSQFSTWLVRIAINEGLMFLRKQRSSKSRAITGIEDESDRNWLEPADQRPNPERELITRELNEKSLADLSPALRALFIRQKLEGWTNIELGKAFGIPPDRVKYRMFRARTLLQKRLEALAKIPCHDLTNAPVSQRSQFPV